MQTVYKKYITTSVIVWAVCFVLFMLAYVFVLGPQKQALTEARQKLAQRDSDFKKAVDAETGALKERLNKEAARLHSTVDNFVSMVDDSSKLAVDLGQIASELNVIGFSSKGSKSEQSAAVLPMCKTLGVDYFYVNFKGNFNQFAKFINALERHKPVIFVDKFMLARSSQGNLSENDINIVLAVFVCPQSGGSSNALMAAVP